MHNVKAAQVSLKSRRVWLRYEKTIIPNKLNHKPQGVSEENKKELEEKSDCLLKYFAVTGSTLEACRRTVTLPIKLKIVTGIVHSIKVLVI